MPFDSLPQDRQVNRNEKTKYVLEEALRLLEKGWCRGDYAMNETGVTSMLSRDAVNFCAVGAVMRAHHNLGYDNIDTDAISKLVENVSEPWHRKLDSSYHYAIIQTWNDHTYKGNVLATFRKIIQQIEEEGI